jgi:hypothetical protein
MHLAGSSNRLKGILRTFNEKNKVDPIKGPTLFYFSQITTSLESLRRTPLALFA